MHQSTLAFYIKRFSSVLCFATSKRQALVFFGKLPLAMSQGLAWRINLYINYHVVIEGLSVRINQGNDVHHRLVKYRDHLPHPRVQMFPLPLAVAQFADHRPQPGAEGGQQSGDASPAGSGATVSDTENKVRHGLHCQQLVTVGWETILDDSFPENVNINK